MHVSGFLLLGLVAATLNPSLSGFLTGELGLSRRALESLQTEAVVEELPVDDESREIAVVGVVPIDVSSQFFLDSFRRTETFMQSAELKRFGTFSRPPTSADVASLDLAEDDLEAIQECKVADCKLKLPAQDIGAFQRLDWSAADVADGATQLFRNRIAGYVRSYLEDGNSALMVYADKPQQMALADGFGKLLSESAPVCSLAPDLNRHLREFPRSSAEGSEDIVYWTIEDFGYRPVTAVTHATIYDQPAGPARAVITHKQIYASHYFHARFTVMALVAASDETNGNDLYLVYVDRSLFDDDLGTINRGLLRRGLTKSLRTRLETLRERLEAAYARNTH